MNFRLVMFVGLTAVAVSAYADTRSNYMGQESRSVKALSAENINDYLSGKGMGYAKAAELNHYPGPRHVLDLSKQLGLSNVQIERSETVFKDMREKAIALGKLLIEKETELDNRFVNGNIDAESLQTLTDEIGALTAQLRFTHLNAHLAQHALLTPQQVKHYDELRGYGKTKTPEEKGEHQHQHNH